MPSHRILLVNKWAVIDGEERVSVRLFDGIPALCPLVHCSSTRVQIRMIQDMVYIWMSRNDIDRRTRLRLDAAQRGLDHWAH